MEEEKKESELTEGENDVIEENKKTFKEYKESLINNLGYLLVILVGIVGLITCIIKEMDLSLSECLIGLGVGGSQLSSYLKNKSKVTLVCMILWYVVALLGLLSLFLA